MATPLTARLHPWIGHGLALILFAAAFLLRWWAGEMMDGLPFVTFFLAILATAALAGTGPAITCLVPSFLSAWYFFLPPSYDFRLVWPQGPLALFFFLLVAGSQVALVHWLRQAHARVAFQRHALADQAARHRLLYTELQHRVANGIQSVASTLSAQAMMSPEAQPALDEAAQRLLGVAEVHRRLHDPELAGALGTKLEAMLRQLMMSAGRSDVSVTVQAEAGTLAPELAGLVGLFVAEAASNSIKHAFNRRLGGQFDVSLLPVGEGALRLVVEDDGPGFSAAAGGGDGSLGMTIMRGLAERLGSELRQGEGRLGGARLSVEFTPDRLTVT